MPLFFIKCPIVELVFQETVAVMHQRSIRQESSLVHDGGDFDGFSVEHYGRGDATRHYAAQDLEFVEMKAHGNCLSSGWVGSPSYHVLGVNPSSATLPDPATGRFPRATPRRPGVE